MRRIILTLVILVSAFALSVDNQRIDNDEIGFQPEPELRHIFKR